MTENNQKINNRPPSEELVEVDTSPARDLVPSEALLGLQPVIAIEEVRARFRMLLAFANAVLTPGIDYGQVPGTGDDKPTLLKPGAEKLIRFFGFRFVPELVEQKMEWGGDGTAPVFYFRYRGSLYRDDVLICAAEGSANSFEKKYRWRWVREYEITPGLNPLDLMIREVSDELFQFQYDKRETSGKYGKSESYWEAWDKAIAEGRTEVITKRTRAGEDRPGLRMTAELFRIPNPEPYDLINTLQKIAQKRAMVAAALVGCYASSIFTQDLEDLGPGGLNRSPDAPMLDQPDVYAPPVQGGAEETELAATPLSPPALEEDFWNFYFDVGAQFTAEEKSVARAVGNDLLEEIGDVDRRFDQAIVRLQEIKESGELQTRLDAKLDTKAEVDLADGVYMTLAAMEKIEAEKLDLEALVLRTGKGTKTKPVRLQVVLDYLTVKDLPVLGESPDLEDDGALLEEALEGGE